MRAQKTITQTVKGADPHAARIYRHHIGQPREHFFGRFIGKRNSQNTARRYLTGLNQPGDTGSQYTRLAGTGAS